MLTHLSIHNYILIRELDMDFSSGLSIITGETGAGKSILLGALGLLMGQRADSNSLMDPSKKCFIEGTFDLHDLSLEAYFKANDLEYDPLTLIRREIQSDGKSRAFVNDSPVTLNILKTLCGFMVDIHSQQQHLYLAQPDFQMQILDHFAQQEPAVLLYRTAFKTYKKALTDFEAYKEQAIQHQKELDYIQFQYHQLTEAKLQNEEEQHELESELQILSHTEEIKTGLLSIQQLLQNEESTDVLQLLKQSLHQAEHIRNVFPKAQEYATRLEQAYLDLKDLSEDAAIENEHIEFQPDRLVQLNERLNLLYELEQKHHVSSLDKLIRLRDQFQQQLNEIIHFEEHITEQKKALDAEAAQLEAMAEQLSSLRQLAIPPIENEVDTFLHQLGIPHGIFRIALSPAEVCHEWGKDHIQFLFSANKQQDLQEVGKVASGGEMSRLMLSIKAVVAQKITLPTLIFDEIDTGVSGEIADKMGNIMAQMASFAQIINITHLPQVAAKGQHHFLVYKCDENNETHTYVKLLSQEERVGVIASMLSGEKLTDAAIEHAKFLLGYQKPAAKATATPVNPKRPNVENTLF